MLFICIKLDKVYTLSYFRHQNPIYYYNYVYSINQVFKATLLFCLLFGDGLNFTAAVWLFWRLTVCFGLSQKEGALNSAVNIEVKQYNVDQT
jgi:hypothetical protein